MRSDEIRSRFLQFFEKRDHAVIPSASLVPEHDPSVLFTTAGMQPLVPYLLGEPHPKGKRLANSQKCVRTQDIEDVGDNTHDTFFEMLGNWSLGDYFKEDAIRWSYTFLTSSEEGLGLDPDRLYITVFGGNADAPKDEESVRIWKELGIPEHRIYYMTDEDDDDGNPNWWSPGANGPCGPDSEMFYDVSERGLGDMTKEEFVQADDRQEVVEVWNDVFMEYEKKDGTVVGTLDQQNVDTGAGLERLCMVLQNTNNVFATDLFAPIMETIDGLVPEHTTLAGEDAVRAKRIVADHMRTATFIISDGVTPSNTDRGYVLRRLIRRAVQYADRLGIHEASLKTLVDPVADKYAEVYTNIASDKEAVKGTIAKEEEKFRNTLAKGLSAFEKLVASAEHISGEEAFDLYQTYGFPLEMTTELAEQRGMTVDTEGFTAALEAHKEKSRQGGAGKFKGGLADHSEMSTKYHTATHMLHAAIRGVLGSEAVQQGSNITPERLRFDFAFPRKMTEEEKQAIEERVNEKIEADLPVFYEDIPIEEAKDRGALGLFEDQYDEVVRVYQIGTEDTGIFSLEFCGGPHVARTGELDPLSITKEEAVGAGVRRVKAVFSS